MGTMDGSVATHIVIPDTQVKPGVPTDHLAWIGWYIGENYVGRPNVSIFHLGDHWDLPSLSTYDGKRKMEGRRLSEDIEAGNEGAWLLDAALKEASPRTRRKPRKVRLRGNHEYRLERYLDDHPEMEGATPSFRDGKDWEVHDFKEVVFSDGVAYSHYFYQQNTSRPYTGQMETRLRNIGTSFTQGHQQGLLYGLRSTLTGRQHGLVAGSCYLHDEDYRGPQATQEWRGIIVCHQVENGQYDPMFVSLEYLCRRYVGATLAEWAEVTGKY